MDSRAKRLKDLFGQGIELPESERSGFLREECGNDEELMHELEQLLGAHEKARGFLETSLFQGPRGRGAPFVASMLEEIEERRVADDRIEVGKEIGRGGMGVVHRVLDKNLQRQLAMKIVLDSRGSPIRGGGEIDETRVARFLEEAQVTGQLEHPGIVPVHEMNMDSEGRIYFTMQLIRGRSFKEIIALAHGGEEGWNITRALGVLLRVCEAMAYAHDKDVVHRDLKPANIMVGKYGEAYVMDWGLARIAGQTDLHDIKLQSVHGTVSDTRTYDTKDRSKDPDTPLLTMDGVTVGTPCYMPPEQAAGRVEEVGPRSDVYAVGAMLYHLLTEEIPYCRPGDRLRPHTVLAMVLQGPPRPVHELAPRVSAELTAICEKAMARRPLDRYADMGQLADDLRAYLEGRVVRAYETGPLAEIKKWVLRNRLAAAAAGVALLAVIGGLMASSFVEARSKRELDLSTDYYEAQVLLNAVDDLWPAVPDRAPAMEAWLGRARGMVSLRGRHEDRRDRFAADGDPAELERTEKLLAAMDRLDGRNGRIAEVEERLDQARTIEERTVRGDQASRMWGEATAAIREHPAYGGLELAPQLGLLPLEPDPDSGLWEFWHVPSGEKPGRGANGKLVIAEATGIVLVLIPGGSFEMGGSPEDEVDFPLERGAHQVALDPFFLSKFEMTQGQWQRVTRSNPSYHQPDWPFSPVPTTLAHPVESVSWSDCDSVTKWLGLTLPTEAQWEYGCRAGTDSRWWTGNDPGRIRWAGNLSDDSLKEILSGYIFEDWDDGYVVHAPVGSFQPNPWGLHDTMGNVFEWCGDPFGAYDSGAAPGNGRRMVPQDTKARAIRGSSWNFDKLRARSSFRYPATLKMTWEALGLRPARDVTFPGS